MSEAREIRDPVFNFIRLTGTEADIVNSSVFQRLRGIRQLAFANLVYPGALHTRFEHSLGVCHVTDLMAKALDVSAEERDLLRLSALLHDIGHGPFSHISEDILEIYSDKREPDNTYKIHESITGDIIKQSEELNRYIRQSDIDKIIKILGSGYGDPLLHSIVSGPLDADKQDYLLRDSYFCGVKYGVFDLNQLHRELRWVEDDVEGKYLMISKDGVHAVEQFVLAKYYITNQVYRHRVRLITDQMLVRAITCGIDHDKIDSLQDLYTYKSDQKYLEEYLLWDDSKFMVTLTDDKFKGKECHDLLTRLKNRNLFKRIYQKQIKELPEVCRLYLSGISKPKNKVLRAKLESHLWEHVCKLVSEKCNGNITCSPNNSNYLIVYDYKIKSVREMSRNDEASIPVEKGIKSPSTFEEESTLFKSIDEKLNQAFVEIYAPVSYDTPVDRTKLKKVIDEVITGHIADFFEGEENATT
ncbi:HD domain-containing protein [Syntrophus buswellii]|uniref:HD domain-containing protein n=1 Tax=Syntrophus buswellii TaxID=43774 RepID=UPI0038D411C4